MATQAPLLDPASQSNYTKIATTHVSLAWNIDFEKRCIHGSATHTLIAKEDVSEVIFDTRVLKVASAVVDGLVVETRLGPEHPVMGAALHIPIPLTRTGDTVEVKIAYKTTESCPALMWLEKELTQGRAFPYLFSQCYPIHARSLAPLQDTPSVKLTFDADVTCVLPVLLSAQRVSPPSDGPPHDGQVIGRDAVTYAYEQVEPVPSYLLAIAAGDLRYRAFTVPEGKTWRCGVWTEPQLLDAAHYEFCEDTPRYLAAAEDLAGPYKFRVYDLLVLPHSFPYGGMENPCLSFITPSESPFLSIKPPVLIPISALITGDRSLTNVVIHELSHSWFGNGVTHAHASHFWLNEGWTTYVERLLQELIQRSSGPRGLSYVIGYKGLVDALELFESTPRYQRLVIGYDVGEDPDAAFSLVPYEKGANLLLLLERTLGGIDVMRPYIKDYVKTYMGNSITTSQWKDHLYSFFAHQQDKIKALDGIDWNAWFYGEGVTLPIKLEYDMTLVMSANELADRWNSSRDAADPAQLHFEPSDVDKLNSKQRVVFLERLETYPALPASHVFHLDALYRFSHTSDARVRMRFYLVALKDPTSVAATQFVQPVLDWVTGKHSGVVQGQMRVSRSLFRAADKVDRARTRAAYEGAKTLFHPITRKLIERDLGL